MSATPSASVTPVPTSVPSASTHGDRDAGDRLVVGSAARVTLLVEHPHLDRRSPNPGRWRSRREGEESGQPSRAARRPHVSVAFVSTRSTPAREAPDSRHVGRSFHTVRGRPSSVRLDESLRRIAPRRGDQRPGGAYRARAAWSRPSPPSPRRRGARRAVPGTPLKYWTYPTVAWRAATNSQVVITGVIAARSRRVRRMRHSESEGDGDRHDHGHAVDAGDRRDVEPEAPHVLVAGVRAGTGDQRAGEHGE